MSFCHSRFSLLMLQTYNFKLLLLLGQNFSFSGHSLASTVSL
jgi:hypothetical protein